MNFIPVYQPFVAANQKAYVNDCLDSNWISSQGKYIEQFEKSVAEYLKVRNVIAVCNGSVSLSLILAGLGIQQGDHVIVQSLTYAATVSSIYFAGAESQLIGSDNRLQMNLDQIEAAITPSTKAIMVAQLYGDAPDMRRLQKICQEKKIHLIEDSAEAFGCWTEGQAIGTFGIASSFSFFGNKTITTGEGGVVCTNDDQLARKMRLLRSQSHIGGFRHNGPGFNFRITNLAAAIGCAQMEHLSEIIGKKKALAQFYRNNLHQDVVRIVPQLDSSEWMPVFLLPDYISYERFHEGMKELGVDTRPVFCPIHLMGGFNCNRPVDLSSTEIYNRGFNLPSFPDLTERQLQYIVESANKVLNQ